MKANAYSVACASFLLPGIAACHNSLLLVLLKRTRQMPMLVNGKITKKFSANAKRNLHSDRKHINDANRMIRTADPPPACTVIRYRANVFYRAFTAMRYSVLKSSAKSCAYGGSRQAIERVT
jgi:hypothetical protein